MRILRASLFLVASFLFTLPTPAATFVVPPDTVLLSESDAVVVGRVLYALPTFDDAGQLVTHVNLIVDRVIKGDLASGASVQILVDGGILRDQARVVTSEPIYWPDGYVLAFLERGEGGFYVTHAQALGKFELVNFAGTELWVRGAPQEEIYGFDYRGNPHVEIPRVAQLFETYLDDLMDGKTPEANYFLRGNRARPVSTGAADDDDKAVRPDAVLDPFAHFPASAYLMGSGTKFRWNRFDQGGSVAFRVSGSQPGYDSTGIAQRALAAWTNEPNSNINLQYAGTSTAGFVQDGQNTIVFNSTTGVPAGAIGYSQISSAGTHTYNGETFYTVVEGDVVMKSGLSVSAAVFEEAVTHEVGHSIAFRHSNEGTPADSNAIMNSVSTGRFGSNLQAWDRDAASHVYGSGTTTPPPPPCSPPVITSQPASRSITAGQSTTLTVGVSGTTPLYYQWYIGTSGNTATPIPGAGGSSVTVTPTVGTNYWVRVSNACGAVNSATVTVNVTAPAPPPGGSGVKGDFNGDGRPDIVLRNYSNGQNSIWLMNGTTLAQGILLPSIGDTAWRIEGAADFDRNGSTDLLLRHSTSGQNSIWFMNGTQLDRGVLITPLGDLNWRFEGTGDFNGDGHADIVLRNYANGQNSIWLMNGTTLVQGILLPPVGDVNWAIEGTGDFNRDGRPDLLWRNYANGQNSIWLMNGTQLQQGVLIAGLADVNWRFSGAADYNGDGSWDILLRNRATGQNSIWLMSGITLSSGVLLPPVGDLSWDFAGPR
jgi:hypothetical protein